MGKYLLGLIAAASLMLCSSESRANIYLAEYEVVADQNTWSLTPNVFFSVEVSATYPDSAYSLPVPQTSITVSSLFSINSTDCVSNQSPSPCRYFNPAPLFVAADQQHPDFTISASGPFTAIGFSFIGVPTGFSVENLTSVTAVPELSTWAMLLIGFAGIGFAGAIASAISTH
jgi:hypothetical protein